MQIRPIVTMYNIRPPLRKEPFINEKTKLLIIQFLIVILFIYIIVYTPIGGPLLGQIYN